MTIFTRVLKGLRQKTRHPPDNFSYSTPARQFYLFCTRPTPTIVGSGNVGDGVGVGYWGPLENSNIYNIDCFCLEIYPTDKFF